MVLGLVFTACDPMDEIYTALDAQEEVILGETTLTMSDDDYAYLELGYGSFSSIDDAKTMIPSLLSNNYPVWGDGSLVNVTFKLYDPIRVEDYTVTSSDYDALLDMGETQGAHLSSNSDINDFFTYKYPQAEQGAYVELTYNKLAGKISYPLVNADYALVGNGNYNNFDIRTGKAEEDIEVRREKIETILLNNFPDTPINQQYLVSYLAFNNSFNAVILEMLVQFDGTNYNMVTGTEYELTDADIALIETELAETYPGPAANVGNYGSFDRRTSSANYWSDEMLVDAFNLVLKNLDPTAVEGSKYAVTFVVYDGSTHDDSMLLQLNNGVYDKLPDTLIELTTLFALTDKWAEPFTLTDDDYSAMGQSYPNFSDEDLAWYRIAIYLKTISPYAEKGDMTAVAYDLYSGSVETEYVNFIFDGAVFNAIPSVVEKSIKFGHDGVAWEPDNTIKYTLVTADYSFIASEFTGVDGFVAAAGNLDNYGNFSRYEGDTKWSDDMLVTAMGVLADNINPTASVGQQYVFTFSTYGPFSTESISIILNESNVWVLNN